MASRVIQISFSDTEYAHLEAKAEAEGMTIALYIKNKVLEDTEFKRWFRELLERVSRIKQEHHSILKWYCPLIGQASIGVFVLRWGVHSTIMSLLGKLRN